MKIFHRNIYFENVVFKNLGPPAPTPAPPGPPGPTAPPSPTTTGVSRATLITILIFVTKRSRKLDEKYRS